jgi:hypothetical protein
MNIDVQEKFICKLWKLWTGIENSAHDVEQHSREVQR